MYAWLYVLFLVCSVLLHECFFAGQSACRHSFRRKTARTLTIATARASIGKCTTSSEHLTNAQQALRRPCAPPASSNTIIGMPHMNSMIAIPHALDSLGHRCIPSRGTRSRVALDQRTTDVERTLHVALACGVRFDYLVDPVAFAHVHAIGAHWLGEIYLSSSIGCRVLRAWRAGELRGLRQQVLVDRLRGTFRCCFRCSCRLP